MVKRADIILVNQFLSPIFVFIILISVLCKSKSNKLHRSSIYTTVNVNTRTICIGLGASLQARHKSCFLRPDTGPCRADIIQWYFDIRQKKCYRFFWGGCQGNGNKFEDEKGCLDYCLLNSTEEIKKIPQYCMLAYDYGNCFGYFKRWAWDPYLKSCRQRLYSGCGGNQNNFETLEECRKNCLNPPSNTLHNTATLTTCVPIEMGALF